jgi:hypothetical protein
MAVRTDGNNFAGRWGRSDTDGNLGLGKTSGQQEAANDGEDYFLHYANLLDSHAEYNSISTL